MSSTIPGIPVYDTRTGNEYTLEKGFYLCTSDVSFATLATAGTKSNWLTLIVAGKIFPCSNIKRVEDASKEALKDEFDDGSEAIMREKQRGYSAYFNLTLDQHKAMMSYNNAFTHFMTFDEAGNIRATSDDGTIIKPRRIGSITVEPMPVGLAGAKPLTKVTIIEADYTEWDLQGVTIQPNKGTVATRWMPTDLSPVTTVTVTQVGSISANAFVVDVHFKSTSDITNTGATSIDRAIAGLLTANFVAKDGSGNVVTQTGIAESGTVPGRYTVSFSAFTAGSVYITPSTTMLFESASLTLV